MKSYNHANKRNEAGANSDVKAASRRSGLSARLEAKLVFCKRFRYLRECTHTWKPNSLQGKVP